MFLKFSLFSVRQCGQQNLLMIIFFIARKTYNYSTHEGLVTAYREQRSPTGTPVERSCSIIHLIRLLFSSVAVSAEAVRGNAWTPISSLLPCDLNTPFLPQITTTCGFGKQPRQLCLLNTEKKIGGLAQITLSGGWNQWPRKGGR